MKPLSEQDYYETLEVQRDASREEIERAYKIACTTYSPDSLAGYSVFEEGDGELLRDRVEMAYRILSNSETRERYDEELAASTPSDLEEPNTENSDPSVFASTASQPAPALESLDDLAELDDGQGEWDGSRLRRARLQQGVELDQIAEVTKVNPTYLQFIEEERFEGLPAAVYVRGFVKGYAGCLGIDADSVALSYMQRYQQPEESSKRRLFSRR